MGLRVRLAGSEGRLAFQGCTGLQVGPREAGKVSAFSSQVTVAKEPEAQPLQLLL